VTFEVAGPLKGPDACHCWHCRKQSGHIFVSTDVPRAAVAIKGEKNITWYQATEKVRRGFCKTCGCALFWDPVKLDVIGIAMGAFDSPTNTRIALHGHVSQKGDYYEITDGIPQRD
jgi:hypothetical protein